MSSPLDMEIENILKDKLVCSEADGVISAKIKFRRHFTGFSGHFPDNPILPGVVIIKIIIKMYELYKGKKYSLSVIKNAKFADPVSADENVFFYIHTDKHIKGMGGDIQLIGKLSKKGKNIAKLSLVLKDAV